MSDRYWESDQLNDEWLGIMLLINPHLSWRFKAEILSFEEQNNFGPIRSVIDFLVPTFGHEIKHVSGTVVGLWQLVQQRSVFSKLRQVFYHLDIWERFKRLFPSKCKDLPERDPEGPNIAFCRVSSLQLKQRCWLQKKRLSRKISNQQCSLPRHPPDG